MCIGFFIFWILASGFVDFLPFLRFWLGGLSLVLVLCEERCMFGGFFYKGFVFLAYDLEGL